MAAAAVGLAVATGTFVVPDAAQAAPTSSTATSEGAKRLNTRAQELFNSGNLTGAADTYAEIFDELPENHVNREERDNNVLVTLESYREAYELRRSSPGDKSLEEAVELLRRAVRVFDRYEAEYRRVYGGQNISAEAAAAGRQIKDLLAAAEKELAPAPAPEPERPAEPSPFSDGGYEPPVGPNGTGLIVAGSVMLAAGLGTTAMIIVGAQMTKKANRDKANAMTDAQADDVDRRGTTGNALIITGAILTAAFVISGATMLGIGIHRRQRYMAFEPAVGRGYAGLTLRGRF